MSALRILISCKCQTVIAEHLPAIMISQCLDRAAFFASVSRDEDARSRLSSALNFRIRIRGIRIARLMTLCALYVNNGYLSRRASGRQFTMPTQKAT